MFHIDNNTLLGLSVAFLIGCALVALKNETTRQFTRFFARHFKKIWFLVLLAGAWFIAPQRYRAMAWMGIKYTLIILAVLVAAILVFGITRSIIDKTRRQRGSP